MAGNYTNNQGTSQTENQESSKDPRSIFNTIVPNILDRYDNHSYNLKLYMIAETTREESQDQSSDTGSSEDQRSNTTPIAINTDRGGFMNGAYTASQKDTVVLCQTGVTGTSIRSLNINQAVGSGSSPVDFGVEMTIEQPGAANFPDQIILAKQRLGIRSKYFTTWPFFLEINFQGYSDNPDEDENTSVEDSGGAIKHIQGPYRYKMLLQDMNVDIKNTGSTYNLRFAVFDDALSKNNKVFKIPEYMETTGNTIEEHIKDLQDKLNVFNERPTLGEDSNQELADIYTFGTDDLIGDKQTIIKDSTVEYPDSLLQTARKKAEAKQQGSTKEFVTTQDSETEKGSENTAIDVPICPHDAGSSIEQAIIRILGGNNDYNTAVNPEGADGKKKVETIIPDNISFNAEVIYFDYDEKRGEYAKEIVYNPVLTKTVSQSTNTEKTLGQKSNTAEVLERMRIKKAYEYIFTGRNDQIINVDIDYNLGINLLLPPKDGEGGYYGDHTFNNPAYFDSGVKKSDEILDNLSNLSDFIGKFKNGLAAIQKLKDDPLRALGTYAGLDKQQIKNLLIDKTGNMASQLASRLADRNLNSAITNALRRDGQSGVNTESDNQRQSLLDSYASGNYTPGPSGYTYSEELLGMDGVNVFAEDINSRNEGGDTSDKDEKQDENNESTSDILVPQHEIEYLESPQTLTASTPANTLFGYLASQRKAMDILYNLKVTLRGDPWYLGRSSLSGGSDYKTFLENEDENAGVTSNENFFLFELRQPEYIDPDVDDEDNNTGLYPMGSTSYFISGVYRITEIMNEFIDGNYRTYINSTKEVAIDWSEILEHSSFEEYRDWFLSTNGGEDGKLGDLSPFTPGNNPRKPEYIDRVLTTNPEIFGGPLGLDNPAVQRYFSSEEISAYKSWLSNRGGT